MITGPHQHARFKQVCVAILAGLGLVHAAFLTRLVPIDASAAAPKAKGTAQPGAADVLPPPVVGMRDAILEAVQSGRLDDLKAALDLNELPPELAADPVPDPQAYWRKTSADGQGRDILTALGTLFELPFAVTPLGKDPENNRLYIWPAFADRPLASLSANEDAALTRLEGAAKAAAMKAGGRYTGWRIVIGADGVWHAFRRYD